MVYRGKPSAGCENCRKAKKRCGLEQPSCDRCVKLKKPCTGYRDTSELQIQDESAAVRQKAERQKSKNAPAASRPGSRLLAPPSTAPTAAASPICMPTPLSMISDSSSGSDSTIDIDPSEDDHLEHAILNINDGIQGGGSVLGTALMLSISNAIRPKPNDVATIYFFNQFTAPGQWEYIRDIASQPKLDPCLELAIQACGMAAMTNVELVPAGREYARSHYGEALGLLNEALRDPERSRSDEALLAVSMLGYYENISCDSNQSMLSWKAHTAGATQMLKLRGKAQFKSHVGRILFREIRAQILIACLWDDREAPAFLQEYQPELEAQSQDDFRGIWKIADSLTDLYYRFAKLRKQLIVHTISDQHGVEISAELERDLIQWSVDAVAEHEFWQYYELEVEESEHVWDAKVYAYAGNPAPNTWNQWRILRTMLSRTQEMLLTRLPISEEALGEQLAYFRRTRRHMTDEICKTIPAVLGHASPAFNSSCVLVTAYAGIWSLFFAGTTLIERVGEDAKYVLYDLPAPSGKPQTAAYAQLGWIMGRLRYISQEVGLKWADGIASILRGEVKMRPKPSNDR